MQNALIELLPRIFGAILIVSGVVAFRRGNLRASSEGADEKEYFGRSARIIAALWILLGLFLFGAFGNWSGSFVRGVFFGGG